MLRFTLIAACASAVGVPSLAQAPQSRISSDSVGPMDQVICRRFLRTGTLADYYRTCKTRGEWERERRNIRQGINNVNSCRTLGGGVGCDAG